MPSLVLYHNPACSKSRGALRILEERGVDVEVIEYIKTGLGSAQIAGILDRIPEPPGDLVRRDKHFEELGLSEADCGSRESVIDLLVRDPKLLQRPIGVAGDRAVIARPSERILELLED